jgi:DNA-binding response OmpR family regulator/DNA-binding CsgD family transcriptional regulator
MKTYNVLIIDDEASNIEIIIDILDKTKLSFNFYHAIDGYKGMDAAKKYKPNIIILDWQMPGMSGIEVLSELKKDSITKNIPVVMTTGKMTESVHLEEALNAGAIDYLRKPVDPLELKARIHAMLRYTDQFYEMIAAKDKEIASNVMNMVEKKNINTTITAKLKKAISEESKEKVKEEIHSVLEMIDTKDKENDLAHFESYFQKIHPDFFGNISSEFPDLTPAELKLAALLRLNLASKEIAAITYTSVGTVKTARFRLRKKMNLSNEENIVNFLMRY